jgi:hypothetical protein
MFGIEDYDVRPLTGREYALAGVMLAEIVFSVICRLAA